MSSRTTAGVSRPHVAVIGGGFCGLAAAYQLGRCGVRATVLERDAEVGGLAGSFAAGGTRLEKFYHHWFTSDVHVMNLIAELGQSDQVLTRPTRTGTYYAHDFFKLSTPVDLLRFSPLPFFDRLRLGLLALRARRVKDWRVLEDRTAANWLREMGGERVYRVVWEPLLRGKFGDLAEEVAAVWFWNKLKLRGGGERLAYHRGGFAAHVWRARYAQPVVECGYRRLLPATHTPVTNLFLATMAQIYPQDRGTNYAIRQGREVARAVATALDGAGGRALGVSTNPAAARTVLNA